MTCIPIIIWGFVTTPFIGDPTIPLTGDGLTILSSTADDWLDELEARFGLPVQPGSGSAGDNIFEIPGGASAAKDVVDGTIEDFGGIPLPAPRYPGELYRLPDGTIIGYRPESSSGDPAIDINPPGKENPDIKIHFPSG